MRKTLMVEKTESLPTTQDGTRCDVFDAVDAGFGVREMATGMKNVFLLGAFRSHNLR
jgi:hypothetical protein